jgi:hypothetical protein
VDSRTFSDSVLPAALVATLAFGTAQAAGDDARDYRSAAASEGAQWGIGTPEADGRPGRYYFLQGAAAVNDGKYRFAVDMYQTAASWAYKPAEYNLAVMYLKGEGVTADKPRAMAWIALAAERGDSDYIEAREVIYAELTPDEFAKANEIWRELKKTYGDESALVRAKARWAQVKANITGSHVGFVGALKIGKHDGNAPWGNWGGGILSGGSMDGSVAYRQLLESKNPYDPKFEHRSGTATVGPIVPLPDERTPSPQPNDDIPHNL